MLNVRTFIYNGRDPFLCDSGALLHG